MSNPNPRRCQECKGTLEQALDGRWYHTHNGSNWCVLPIEPGGTRADPEPQLATSGQGHSSMPHYSGPSYAQEDHGHEDLTERIRELNMERAGLTRKLREHNHDQRYRTHAEAVADLLDHFDAHHKPSLLERERRKVVKGWATGLLGGALLGPPVAALVPWDLVVQPPLWVVMVVLYLWGMLLAAAVTAVMTGGQYPSNLGRKLAQKRTPYGLRTDASGERLLRGDERMFHG